MFLLLFGFAVVVCLICIFRFFVCCLFLFCCCLVLFVSFGGICWVLFLRDCSFNIYANIA